LAEERGATVGSPAVFVGLGLVLAAHVARSVAEPASPIASVLLGSLPNFGAGLALPFVVTNAQDLFGRRPWLTGLRFCVVCAGAFAVLALWEYVQLAAWRYQFDTNDVVASGVGAVLAALIGAWLRPRRASGGARVGDGDAVDVA
jgi:hypothetical protein